MNEPMDYARDRRAPGLDTPTGSLLSAALFLFCGWYFRGLHVPGGPPLYDFAARMFSPMGFVVGGGLIVIAGLIAVGMRWAIILDVIVGAIATLGCLFIGGIWLLYGDMEGALLLIFGAFNGSATRAAWNIWQADRARSSDEPREFAHTGTAAGQSPAGERLPHVEAPPRPPIPRPPTPPPVPAVPPPPPAAPIACPECGRANAPSTLFCEECGKKLFAGSGGLRADR